MEVEMNQPYTIHYCAQASNYRHVKIGSMKCAKARFGWCTGKKPVTIIFGYDLSK